MVAFDDIDAGLTANPKRYDLINLKGVIFHNQGKYKAAVEEYTKCLSLDPNQAQAYVNRSKSYFELKQYKQAWQDINTAGQMKVPLDKAYFMKLQSLVQ